MPTETHRLLSGETIEYERPTGPLAAFLRRVRDAVNDPRVTASELAALPYGPDNPLLDQTVLPGRGVVTKAVFANPVYHLMLDLLAQKRVQEGTLDVDKAAARHTLTVAEAADRAGVHESAIRQAIAANRLPSWKRGTRHFVSPDDVDAYKPARHGPAPPLEVRFGSKEGARLSLKHDGGELVTDKEGSIHTGHIERWKCVGVLASSGEKARFWLLEPGEEVEDIAHAGFYVRGRMRVVAKENNAQKAREEFRLFDKLQRYYVHGDQSEKDPERFYCRRCDTFELPAHFDAADHVAGRLDRYAASIKTLKSYEQDRPRRFRRPSDATNIIAKHIPADEEAAAGSPFFRWLGTQAKRDDVVGDFAGDARRDPGFPRLGNMDAIRSHVRMKTSDPGILKSMERAMREFAKLAKDER